MPALSDRLSIDPSGQLLRTLPGGPGCEVTGVWEQDDVQLFSLRFF